MKHYDDTPMVAKFAGAFGEYEINASKHMSGYYIFTKKGGYDSVFVGEDTGEIVFKDCTKSMDEIKELVSAKEPKQEPKVEFQTLEFQNEAQKTKKKRAELSFDFKKPDGFGFEIVEEEQKGFEIQEEPQINKIGFEIVDDETNEQESQTSQADEQKDIEKTTDNPAKIYFAKGVILPKGKIVEIEVIISGYDELCDGFYFDEILDECEYKYSIKAGELRALFIANLTDIKAQSFISSFSFKTSRQTPKKIEIFVNETSTAIFSVTLFS